MITRLRPRGAARVSAHPGILANHEGAGATRVMEFCVRITRGVRGRRLKA